MSEPWDGCLLGESPSQGSVHVWAVPQTASGSAFTGHVVSVRCYFLFFPSV